MNRLSRLELAIESWSKFHLINDIVIVDWSSADPISNCKSITKNKKVHIIRVEDQQYFSLARSFNLAYDFTNPKNEILVKIDADYLLTDETLFYKLFTSKTFTGTKLIDFFFTGSDTFSKNLSGFLIINKSDFCYYNENMSGWGYEDMDLYERVKHKNINHIIVPTLSDYIYHIPHDDNLRVANYQIKDKWKGRELNKNLSQPNYHRVQPNFIVENKEKNYTQIKLHDAQ
jgi:predicted glycosyltransferase involved in capsule biosynthesis